MAITHRDLPEGTRLVANYKKEEYHLKVVKGGFVRTFSDGSLFDEKDPAARLFKSPSAAGSAVMGGIACNGWHFWSLAGEAAAAGPRGGDAQGHRADDPELTAPGDEEAQR